MGRSSFRLPWYCGWQQPGGLFNWQNSILDGYKIFCRKEKIKKILTILK